MSSENNNLKRKRKCFIVFKYIKRYSYSGKKSLNRWTFLFQQHNAPIHIAKKIVEFLAEHNVTILKYPALSPELSPIENVGAMLKIYIFPKP